MAMTWHLIYDGSLLCRARHNKNKQLKARGHKKNIYYIYKKSGWMDKAADSLRWSQAV